VRPSSPDACDDPRFPDPRRGDDLPRAHRPREKLLARGARELTDVELLAIVIDGRRRTGPDPADLLRRHGLSALGRLDASGWRRHAEVGRVAAARIAAAFELGRRACGEPPPDRPRVTRPHAAWTHVREIGRARKEHLVGLYLDAQNGLLHRETISTGSLNTTRTHPREILYPAIEHLALGFVLAHNHPSGCLEPSPEDIEFTRAVRRAGELIGIELYDHLIVAGERYLSLRERGVL